MLAALIIVFREIIEAGIVVGIVLAATRSVPRRGLWVAYGIGAGVLGACIVALFARTISEALSGFGQEYFNVGILTVAVGMLTWHNVWMARHGREMAMEMKAIGEAVAHGQRTLMALAIVVGIAVLREGSEIVLFLYSIAISGTDSAFSMVMGGLLGLVMGVSVAAVTYLGLLHIPNRHLFRVTGWLLALLAAGMAAQAVAFLEQAQAVNAFGQTAWNTSWLLSDTSLMGKALHTLVGYNERPTVLQVMVYAVTLIVTFTLMRLFGHSGSHHPKQHAPHAA
ncbi:MAG TPA: FTR1 family protein [Rickettsiales bacterium]|nr:FTR1 family protein [Rickettsiales bacterium]